MPNVHNQDYHIQIKTGLASAIHAIATVYQMVTGEMAFTTDTKKVFIFNATDMDRVHGLDMALTFEGEILTLNDEILWIEKVRTGAYTYA